MIQSEKIEFKWDKKGVLHVTTVVTEKNDADETITTKTPDKHDYAPLEEKAVVDSKMALIANLATFLGIEATNTWSGKQKK